MDVATEPGTALTVLHPADVSTVISADKNDLLGALAAKVAAHKPDATTVMGRKAIVSLAAEVAGTKMDLLRLGKGLTEGWRKSTAAVNAECKVIEANLDELKARVRAPVTAYEKREEDRVAGHEAVLAKVAGLVRFDEQPTVITIESRLALAEHGFDRDWEEFQPSFEAARAEAIERLKGMIAVETLRLQQEAEATKKRREEEEAARQEAVRLQAENDTRIREEAAQAERDRAAASVAEAEAAARRAETARIAAEQATENERVRAAKVAKVMEETSARDAAAAKKQAEVSAQHAAAEATRLERQRAAREAEDARIANEARAADVAHRRKINSEALADLRAVSDLTIEQAQAVMREVILGHVRHLKIQY